MILDVAILVERVISTFSVKGIKHHSMNREMFGTELMTVCCVICRMKKFWISCCCCSSTPWQMQQCCHLRHLIYWKSTWYAVWHSSATDISHRGELWWYHRLPHTEECNRKLLQRFTEIRSGLSLLLLMVILAYRINQTS